MASNQQKCLLLVTFNCFSLVPFLSQTFYSKFLLLGLCSDQTSADIDIMSFPSPHFRSLNCKRTPAAACVVHILG